MNRMKSAIIGIILLLASPAWADMNCYMTGSFGSAAAAASFCSTCTGEGTSPSFCWPIDSDAVDGADISSSGGCSAGDATATIGSSAAVESAPSGKSGYALYIPTTYDRVNFDVSSRDIVTEVAGTITLDFYVDTWCDGQTPVWIETGDTANNLIYVQLLGTDEIRLYFEGNGSFVQIQSTDYNLAEDTWYSLTIKWTTSDVDPNLSIQVDSKTAVTSDTNLTAFNATYPPTKLQFGEMSGICNAPFYVKNIKVWKAWQN